MLHVIVCAKDLPVIDVSLLFSFHREGEREERRESQIIILALCFVRLTPSQINRVFPTQQDPFRTVFILKNIFHMAG